MKADDHFFCKGITSVYHVQLERILIDVSDQRNDM